MNRFLKKIALGVVCAATVSGLTAGVTMARIMEIDITYYDDAGHTNIVGTYYKGCDGKVYKTGVYSDFYDYVGTPC